MNIKKDWWKDFFSGITVDLWLAVVSAEQSRAEADFIEKALQVPAGAKLLDAPCGGGRLALELASRGYQLTGVDIAPDFLREARSQAAERQLRIAWEQRDMRDLPWPATFDGAFCFGNSFGYFEDDGNESFLKAVACALKPGARFVLDTASVEMILPNFQEHQWSRAGSIIMLEENRYDHVQGRIDTEYTFIAEGKMEKRWGFQRLYSYSELCRLLEKAGFAKSEGYGSLSQEPFKLGSQRLLLVTGKKDSS